MIVIGQKYMDSASLRSAGIGECGDRVMVHETCQLVDAANIRLGSHVRIDPWCILSGSVTIGSYVHIGASCYLAGAAGIDMADFSGLSQGVRIYSLSDDYLGGGLTNPTVPEHLLNVKRGRVTLGRHVIVGSGTVILPTSEIPEGAAVGALSLVRGRLDAWTVYAGCPAKAKSPRRQDVILRGERELMATHLPIAGAVAFGVNPAMQRS